MYKAIVLIVASTAALATARLTSAAHERILSHFQEAQLVMEVIREDTGLRQARHPQLAEAPTVGDWTTIDYTDVFGCASGFAYGLQFSPVKKGVCYQAI